MSQGITENNRTISLQLVDLSGMPAEADSSTETTGR